jgi:hypothetical protein
LFSDNHGKAALLFASPGCFNRGIQRVWSQDVRFECDTFDNVDDFRDFARTVGDLVHGVQPETLLHGEETDLYADAGYQGIEKRCERRPVRWHVAMRPCKRRQLNLGDRLEAIFDQIERLKAGISTRVEHPFRVLKRQSGYALWWSLAMSFARLT